MANGGVIAQTRCASDAERKTYVTPWGMTVTVHKAVRRRFRLACKRADKYARFRPLRIDSYVCRMIRGVSSLSWHGKAAAWDFFATAPGVPPPGGVWTPDDTYGPRFAKCFTDLGFTWGAKWDREDDPHMEWRPPVVPPLTLRERVTTYRLARRRARRADA